jgi:hypothetical protein
LLNSSSSSAVLFASCEVYQSVLWASRSCLYLYNIFREIRQLRNMYTEALITYTFETEVSICLGQRNIEVNLAQPCTTR